MTKSDLVEQVADVIGPRVTKRDCGLVVDAFLAAVKDTLARGDHIEIRGFGTFKVRHRKARTARNPRTGESVEVPPRAAPVFTPSRHLRSQVDRGSGVSGGGRALRGRRRTIGFGALSRRRWALARSTVRCSSQHTLGNTQGLARGSAPSIPYSRARNLEAEAAEAAHAVQARGDVHARSDLPEGDGAVG